MGRHGENRLCPWSFHVTARPSSATPECGTHERSEDPTSRTWAITANQGLGLSPSPPTVLKAEAVCSLRQLGEPPAHPFTLVPTSRKRPPYFPHVSMEMNWFCTYEVPRSCPSLRKQCSWALAEWRDPSNRVDREVCTGLRPLGAVWLLRKNLTYLLACPLPSLHSPPPPTLDLGPL